MDPTSSMAASGGGGPAPDGQPRADGVPPEQGPPPGAGVRPPTGPPPIEMSPVFQALVLVIALYLGWWWIQPVLSGAREYLRPAGSTAVDHEKLRKKRNQAFSGKTEAVKEQFSGLVAAKGFMPDLLGFVSAHCDALKKAGLELITEDPSLTSLHCLSVLLDNCFLKGLTSFPAKNDKLRRELLQFSSGERMLNLCGFYLQDKKETGCSDKVQVGSAQQHQQSETTSSIAAKVGALQQKIQQEQQFYAFEPEQKLNAMIARACIAYCLDISKSKGTRRWLKVDPKILIPDELEVLPRDLLSLYAQPAKVLADSAAWSGSTSGGVASWMGGLLSGGSKEEKEDKDAAVETWLFASPKCGETAEADVGMLAAKVSPSVERLSLKEKNLESAIQEAVVEAIAKRAGSDRTLSSSSSSSTGAAASPPSTATTPNTAPSAIPSHSVTTDAARLWAQKARSRHRELVFESQKLSKVKNESILSDEEFFGELRSEFFEHVVGHGLLPPNLKMAHFHWEGEIPHAFGLQSTQGGSKSSSGSLAGPGRNNAAAATSTDVAMRQIALEALPHWTTSDAWHDVLLRNCPPASPRPNVHLLSVGAALDYTNNRGFVCCVVVGEVLELNCMMVDNDCEEADAVEASFSPSAYGLLPTDEDYSSKKCIVRRIFLKNGRHLIFWPVLALFWPHRNDSLPPEEQGSALALC